MYHSLTKKNITATFVHMSKNATMTVQKLFSWPLVLYTLAFLQHDASLKLILYGYLSLNICFYPELN